MNEPNQIQKVKESNPERKKERKKERRQPNKQPIKETKEGE